MSEEGNASALSREVSKYEDAKQREIESYKEEQQRREDHYNQMMADIEERRRLPLGAKIFLVFLGILFFTSFSLWMMSLGRGTNQVFDNVMTALLSF